MLKFKIILTCRAVDINSDKISDPSTLMEMSYFK